MAIDHKMIRSRLAHGVRLGRYLMSEPGTVTSIDVFARPDDPWAAGRPWWNSRAVRYLARRLQPGVRAFEWGCGGSTVWLVRHGAQVISVEHDPGWAGRVAARCPQADIRLIRGQDSGVTRSEPELRDKGQHFFDDYVAAIDGLPDGSIDIVLVDGLCRIECLRHGAAKVKPGGMLVLDDSDFPFLSAAGTHLPGWRTTELTGFKRPLTVRGTTFFHRPG